MILSFPMRGRVFASSGPFVFPVTAARKGARRFFPFLPGLLFQLRQERGPRIGCNFRKVFQHGEDGPEGFPMMRIG